MAPHLTDKEQTEIRRLVGQKRYSGAEAARKLNAQRRRRGTEEVDPSVVYNFLRGKTHRTDLQETRPQASHVTSGRQKGQPVAPQDHQAS